MTDVQKIRKELIKYLSDSDNIKITDSEPALGEIIKFGSVKNLTYEKPYENGNGEIVSESGFEMVLKYDSNKKTYYYDYKILKDNNAYPLNKAFFAVADEILSEWEKVIRNKENFKFFRQHGEVYAVLNEKMANEGPERGIHDMSRFFEAVPVEEQIDYVIEVFKQDKNRRYKFFSEYLNNYFLKYKMLFKNDIKLIIDFTKKALEKETEKGYFFSEMNNLFANYLFTNGRTGEFFVPGNLLSYEARNVINSFAVYNCGKERYDTERWWDTRDVIVNRGKRSDEVFKKIIESLEESAYYELFGLPRTKEKKESFLKALIYESTDMFLHKDFPLNIIKNDVLLNMYVLYGKEIYSSKSTAFEELLFYVSTEKQIMQKGLHRNTTILNVIRKDAEKYQKILNNEEMNELFIESKKKQLKEAVSFSAFFLNQLEKYPYAHGLSKQTLVSFFVSAARGLKFIRENDIYRQFDGDLKILRNGLRSLVKTYPDVFLKSQYNSFIKEIFLGDSYNNRIESEIIFESLKRTGGEIVQSPARAVAIYGVGDKPLDIPLTYGDFKEYKKTRIINRMEHLKKEFEKIRNIDVKGETRERKNV